MKRSAGIVVFNDTYILLQKRGSWNFKKDVPLAFAGAYQVTAHGQCERGESFFEAAVREAHEELGQAFCEFLDFSLLQFVDEGCSAHQKVHTFGLKQDISANAFKHLRLECNSGGLVRLPLAKVDGLKPISERSIPGRDYSGFMFPDEISALKKLPLGS